MTPLSAISLTLLLMSAPAPTAAQDELASVATLHLADGTTVALVEWRLTYEFITWKSKEPINMAKPQVRPSAGVVLGKKVYPVKGDTLTLTHVEANDSVKVTSMNLKKVGDLKIEPPAREAIAPDLEKGLLYQPRTLDLAGKTLSGIERSFCLASYNALVECGGTETTRVVKIDFN